MGAQESQHPLLVVGAGANRKLTSNMLRQFVDEIGIPFCDTMMGKGVIDSSALPLCAGAVHVHNLNNLNNVHNLNNLMSVPYVHAVSYAKHGFCKHVYCLLFFCARVTHMSKVAS